MCQNNPSLPFIVPLPSCYTLKTFDERFMILDFLFFLLFSFITIWLYNISNVLTVITLLFLPPTYSHTLHYADLKLYKSKSSLCDLSPGIAGKTPEPGESFSTQHL